MKKVDDTLGSLIDKISIVNIKIFFVLNDQKDLEVLIEKKENDGDNQEGIDKIYAEIGKVAEKVQLLNNHRTDLIDMIDEFLDLAIQGKATIQRPKFKKYGSSKDILSNMSEENDGSNYQQEYFDWVIE